MSPQRKLNLTFAELVSSIRQAHDLFSAQAGKSVNISLTLRNWFIGMYITEYELHGADRAGYGENLFNELAAKLAQHNVSGCRFRQLYNYRAFYRAYPQILRTVSAKSKELLHTIVQPAAKLRTASAKLAIDPAKLVSSLSYSHFELLVEIEDPLKRAFYEVEGIRANWSVRELRRQIATLYYERTGLSRNKKKLASLVEQTSEKQEARPPPHQETFSPLAASRNMVGRISATYDYRNGPLTPYASRLSALTFACPPELQRRREPSAFNYSMTLLS